jgi:gliding motility-associated-like protein
MLKINNKNELKYVGVVIALFIINNFNAQTHWLGDGASVINNVCNLTLQDPGGPMNYPNNVNITQTFCPPPGSCLRLVFSQYQMQNFGDLLYIYDGTEAIPENLLGQYGNQVMITNNTPQTHSSSEENGGCITVRFVTNASGTAPGFTAQFICIPCDQYGIHSGICSDARPFCSGTIEDFPAGTGMGVAFGTNIFNSSVACMSSSQNPVWYYIDVTDAGPMNIELSGIHPGTGQSIDIDHVCWGPFSSVDEACNLLSTTTFANNSANIVSCDYSGATTTVMTIPNAQPGEIYMLLVANYSNLTTNIIMQQTGGAGLSDCNVTCEMELNALQGACDPQTNQFALNGTISLFNPPETGSLIINLSTGQTLNIEAPFSDLINFEFNGIPSNGLSYHLNAYFSSDESCQITGNYIAPVSCVECSVQILPVAPVCEGESITLSAQEISFLDYNWAGPGSFSQVGFNVEIINATSALSGFYVLTVSNPTNNCVFTDSVLVTIHSIPSAPIIQTNAPVCQEGTITLSGPSPTAGTNTTYQWTGPQDFFSNQQNVVINNANSNNAGEYSLNITELGCVSSDASVQVEVNPLPFVDAGEDLIICSGQVTSLGSPGSDQFTYQWFPITGLDNPSSPTSLLTIQNNESTELEINYVLTATHLNCASYDTITITVNPFPDVQLSLPSSQCFDDHMLSFSVDGSFSSQAEFFWQFSPDGQPFEVSGSSVINVSFLSAGEKTITLTISDGDCLNQSISSTLELFDSPEISISSSATNVCIPEKIDFYSTINSTDPLQLILWDFGNGLTNNQQNASAIYTTEGNFYVSCLLVTSQGCSTLAQLPYQILAFNRPESAFSIQPKTTDIISPYTFVSDLSNNAQYVYYWIDYEYFLDEVSPKITFQDTGLYAIMQIATNDAGCSDTSLQYFEVQTGFRIYIPNSFSPNGDGLNDLFLIKGEGIGRFSIEVYNRWGELLYLSNDINNGWDGRSMKSNEVCQDDIYLYVISAYDKEGVYYPFKGRITLLK